jgi:hypothetical protein
MTWNRTAFRTFAVVGRVCVLGDALVMGDSGTTDADPLVAIIIPETPS